MGGKLNRGLSVVDTAYDLRSKSANSSPLSPKEIKDLTTLGWCTELLQAYFLVADDIMDASHTRRGQPCWYKMKDVGMIAINDAFMLEAAIYTLLKKHFRTHPAYIDLVELFHEITLQTEIGQLCDLLTAPEDHVDLSQFSMSKQRFIIVYKTAYYSFYLPVVLALHYLNVATPKNLAQAKDILILTGEYFQCQDDYLDVFADEATLGKRGTDIQDNKCSWVINAALERADDKQRVVLDENYGRKDEQMERKCKDVFNEIGIQQVYARYEEDVVGNIRSMIAMVDESEGLTKGVFTAFLDKIYKRSK